jgi:hypothetical protein
MEGANSASGAVEGLLLGRPIWTVGARLASARVDTHSTTLGVLAFARQMINLPSFLIVNARCGTIVQTWVISKRHPRGPAITNITPVQVRQLQLTDKLFHIGPTSGVLV